MKNMQKISSRMFFIKSSIFLLAFLAPLNGYSAGKSAPSPKTISALQTAYSVETLRVHTYQAFSQKASAEQYPNIARLLSAFVFSESIHAANFKKLLLKLKADKQEDAQFEISCLDTKTNLRNAVEAELEDIDKNYPQFIAAAQTEGQKEILTYFTYALESEKQHRDLLLKIQSKAGMFFPMLAKKIEDKFYKCVVCRKCGATDTKIPPHTCPICSESVVFYREIDKPGTDDSH
jgi:rubrerythrin